MGSLRDKIAVVAGATRGAGRGIASALREAVEGSTSPPESGCEMSQRKPELEVDLTVPQISVQRADDSTFHVTVAGPSTTTHDVTVDPSYHQRLAGNRCPPEVLVERSFEFLLEREPNTAILRRFDLTVIGQYFPEYEREIRKRLP